MAFGEVEGGGGRLRVSSGSSLIGAAVAALLALAGIGIYGSNATPEGADSVKAAYRRPAAIPFPANNPYSDAKAELGRTLFFDPRVSGAGNIACATCHNPGLAWSDGLATAIGVGAQRLQRRSPTLLNLAWGTPLMWDGRFDDLEHQAAGPVSAPGEMNQTMPALAAKLAALPGYRRLFDSAFPGEGIGEKTITQAIATFERGIVSGKAPFDRWIEGDESAISESAERGFALFNGKGRCAQCHSGWRFTDDSFHDIGLADDDLGRGRIRPKVPLLQHAFKTPGLRNAARRAPYMHDGSVPTLIAVMRHYNNGFVARPSLSPEMKPLHLSDAEMNDLVSFMLALTSEDAPVAVPALPAPEEQ
jgi:cytochrome c peroxidase